MAVAAAAAVVVWYLQVRLCDLLEAHPERCDTRCPPGVQVPEDVVVTDGPIIMPLLSGTFIASTVRIDEFAAAKAARPAGEGTLAEIRQKKKIQDSPIFRYGQVDHGLAEFILRIGILDEVSLVDDIHQMEDFCGTPEDFAHPDTKLEFIMQMKIGQFPNIKMGALVISAVKAVKRNECEAASALPFMIVLRLQDK